MEYLMQRNLYVVNTKHKTIQQQNMHCLMARVSRIRLKLLPDVVNDAL